MFGRDFMIRTNNRTLKETPYILNSVGVDITINPLLGQLPIDPKLAKLCDQGEIERYNSDAFTAMARILIQTLPQVISAKVN